MSPQQVLDALDCQPRCELGSYPTALVALDRLGPKIGRRIYLKRDDTLGPAGGGNKTRKLEFLMADALEKGATRVVTVGGPQSNHVRSTAAAARMLGLEPHLLLFGSKPERAVGNLLVDQLLGAHLHFIPPGPIARGACTFEELDAHVREEASKRVGENYHVPLGGSNGIGTLGYIRAAIEIDEQAREAGISDAWIVVAAGTGGTLAGLLMGLRLIGSGLRPIGIDIGSFWSDFPGLLSRLANDAVTILGMPAVVEAADAAVIEGTYVGRGYAVPTPECEDAIRRLVRSEGFLLDPTYTGKAFAGLLDLHANAYFAEDDPVIFWHTGGLPGLFSGRM